MVVAVDHLPLVPLSVTVFACRLSMLIFKSLFNLLPLKSHQSISSIMPLPENENEWKKLYVVFATSKGKVRKNSLEDFISIQSTGKIAMKLDTDDKIIGVTICRNDQDVILSTQLGKCIRFMSQKLRIFKGRSSKGIKGMELGAGDKVMSLSVVDNVNIKPKMAKNLLKNGSADKVKTSEIKAKQKISKSQSSELTTRLKTMILSIDGNSEKAYINNFVDNEFLSRDSLAFRQYLSSITPDVDMSTTVVDSAGKEMVVSVPVTVRFFWPSARV